MDLRESWALGSPCYGGPAITFGPASNSFILWVWDSLPCPETRGSEHTGQGSWEASSSLEAWDGRHSYLGKPLLSSQTVPVGASPAKWSRPKGIAVPLNIRLSFTPQLMKAGQDPYEWLPRGEILRNVKGWTAQSVHALIGISRTCHPTMREWSLLKSSWTFAGMGHIQGWEQTSARVEQLDLCRVPSDHSGGERGLKSREKTQEPGRAPGRWKWDSTLLSNTWIKTILKETIAHGTEWKWKQTHQNLWNAANAVLRGRCIALNFTSKMRKDLKSII